MLQIKQMNADNSYEPCYPDLEMSSFSSFEPEPNWLGILLSKTGRHTWRSESYHFKNRRNYTNVQSKIVDFSFIFLYVWRIFKIVLFFPTSPVYCQVPEAKSICISNIPHRIRTGRTQPGSCGFSWRECWLSQKCSWAIVKYVRMECVTRRPVFCRDFSRYKQF